MPNEEGVKVQVEVVACFSTVSANLRVSCEKSFIASLLS